MADNAARIAAAQWRGWAESVLQDEHGFLGLSDDYADAYERGLGGERPACDTAAVQTARAEGHAAGVIEGERRERARWRAAVEAEIAACEEIRLTHFGGFNPTNAPNDIATQTYRAILRTCDAGDGEAV